MLSTGDMSPGDNIVGALHNKLQTQSSAPEDVRNYRPKHVKLIVASSWFFMLLYPYFP